MPPSMRDFQERGRQDWRPEVPLSEEQKQRDLENLVKFRSVKIRLRGGAVRWMVAVEMISLAL